MQKPLQEIVERRGLEGAHQTTASGWTEGSAVRIPPPYLDFFIGGPVNRHRFNSLRECSLIGGKSGKMEMTEMVSYLYCIVIVDIITGLLNKKKRAPLRGANIKKIVAQCFQSSLGDLIDLGSDFD